MARSGSNESGGQPFFDHTKTAILQLKTVSLLAINRDTVMAAAVLLWYLQRVGRVVEIRRSLAKSDASNAAIGLQYAFGSDETPHDPMTNAYCVEGSSFLGVLSVLNRVDVAKELWPRTIAAFAEYRTRHADDVETDHESPLETAIFSELHSKDLFRMSSWVNGALIRLGTNIVREVNYAEARRRNLIAHLRIKTLYIVPKMPIRVVWNTLSAMTNPDVFFMKTAREMVERPVVGVTQTIQGNTKLQLIEDGSFDYDGSADGNRYNVDFSRLRDHTFSTGKVEVNSTGTSVVLHGLSVEEVLSVAVYQRPPDAENQE